LVVRENKIMNTKQEIVEKIKKILLGLGVKKPQVQLDIPAHVKMGDYSSSVAMVCAKELNKKPIELAEEIKSKLVSNNTLGLLKIEVVNPGFINFFFDKNYFGDVVKEVILEKEGYGKSDSLGAKKIMVEFTDPNPFKEFHIGHLMSNTIGESISRIIIARGAEVKRACYQGDVGLHVAKAIWDLLKKEIYIVRDVRQSASAYVAGSELYESSSIIKGEVDEVNKKIYSRTDEIINKLYDQGKKVSLDYFETIYKKLGTKFDYYFFESEVGVFGQETVEKNLPNIFEGSEGAVVFKGEKYDPTLHTRVFINKDGLPTYEAKELGLAKIKYDRYPYDESVVITGNEINEYFRVLLKAMSLIFPDLAKKTKHLSHGMLRLPTGKMSSRTGKVITAESLILEVQEKILEKMKDREISDDKKKEISEIIAIGALKYSILKQTTGKDIIFDFDKSLSFEGDSGPYLQYATVRANSILKKVENIKLKVESEIPENWTTTNLERLLERFPSVVERAGTEYAPSHVATYLIELAGEFNSFYASHKIIDETDPTSPYRLALTQAFVHVMTSGLNLLGIKVPSQM